ncbi:hypothetical protein BLNAU_5656 [Blattamonas nauphoetae]|uniref:Uncharacterized protein n=1 Tax=Blattamonas nauphoetae TaxID=2049346 RepID=A0ABQ9Y6I6_9EUKA|nr:hypothetical protein BLNAU_5656 [Blattamonas nauphoetae]
MQTTDYTDILKGLLGDDDSDSSVESEHTVTHKEESVQQRKDDEPAIRNIFSPQFRNKQAKLLALSKRLTDEPSFTTILPTSSSRSQSTLFDDEQANLPLVSRAHEYISPVNYDFSDIPPPIIQDRSEEALHFRHALDTLLESPNSEDHFFTLSRIPPNYFSTNRRERKSLPFSSHLSSFPSLHQHSTSLLWSNDDSTRDSVSQEQSVSPSLTGPHSLHTSSAISSQSTIFTQDQFENAFHELFPDQRQSMSTSTRKLETRTESLLQKEDDDGNDDDEESEEEEHVDGDGFVRRSGTKRPTKKLRTKVRGRMSYRQRGGSGSKRMFAASRKGSRKQEYERAVAPVITVPRYTAYNRDFSQLSREQPAISLDDDSSGESDTKRKDGSQSQENDPAALGEITKKKRSRSTTASEKTPKTPRLKSPRQNKEPSRFVPLSFSLSQSNPAKSPTLSGVKAVERLDDEFELANPYNTPISLMNSIKSPSRTNAENTTHLFSLLHQLDSSNTMQSRIFNRLLAHQSAAAFVPFYSQPPVHSLLPFAPIIDQWHAHYQKQHSESGPTSLFPSILCFHLFVQTPPSPLEPTRSPQRVVFQKENSDDADKYSYTQLELVADTKQSEFSESIVTFQKTIRTFHQHEKNRNQNHLLTPLFVIRLSVEMLFSTRFMKHFSSLAQTSFVLLNDAHLLADYPSQLHRPSLLAYPRRLHNLFPNASFCLLSQMITHVSLSDLFIPTFMHILNQNIQQPKTNGSSLSETDNGTSGAADPTPSPPINPVQDTLFFSDLPICPPSLSFTLSKQKNDRELLSTFTESTFTIVFAHSKQQADKLAHFLSSSTPPQNGQQKPPQTALSTPLSLPSVRSYSMHTGKAMDQRKEHSRTFAKTRLTPSNIHAPYRAVITTTSLLLSQFELDSADEVVFYGLPRSLEKMFEELGRVSKLRTTSFELASANLPQSQLICRILFDEGDFFYLRNQLVPNRISLLQTHSFVAGLFSRDDQVDTTQSNVANDDVGIASPHDVSVVVPQVSSELYISPEIIHLIIHFLENTLALCVNKKPIPQLIQHLSSHPSVCSLSFPNTSPAILGQKLPLVKAILDLDPPSTANHVFSVNILRVACILGLSPEHVVTQLHNLSQQGEAIVEYGINAERIRIISVPTNEFVRSCISTDPTPENKGEPPFSEISAILQSALNYTERLYTQRVDRLYSIISESIALPDMITVTNSLTASISSLFAHSTSNQILLALPTASLPLVRDPKKLFNLTSDAKMCARALMNTTRVYEDISSIPSLQLTKILQGSPPVFVSFQNQQMTSLSRNKPTSPYSDRTKRPNQKGIGFNTLVPSSSKSVKSPSFSTAFCDTPPTFIALLPPTTPTTKQLQNLVQFCKALSQIRFQYDRNWERFFGHYHNMDFGSLQRTVEVILAKR